jgi:hypothetical protein
VTKDLMRAQLKITLVQLLSHAHVMHTKIYLKLFIQPSQWNNLNLLFAKFGSIVSPMNSGQNKKTVLDCCRLRFTHCQWDQLSHLLQQDQLNNGQFSIFTKMLNTSKQKLVFMHAVEGTGKTFVIRKKNQELASQGEICRCTCPKGVGASHLPQGRTFHSVFRTWMPSLSASAAIDDIIKSLGGNQLKIVVVDKVSMLNTEFLVLVDTTLIHVQSG